MQIEEYLADQDLSPRTKEDYRRDLLAFFQFSAGNPPTVENVRAWISHLENKRRSFGHIQRCLYALKGYCQWMGLNIFAGPHERSKDKIRAPRMKFKEPPNICSLEDVGRMFNSCRTPRETMLLKLLANTGARIGELMAIKISSDINWEDNTIGLTRKGYSERRQWVSISPDTMAAIKEYLDWRHTDSDLLLPFCYHELHRSFKALAKRAGVVFPPGSLFHNLRHVFALYQKSMGAPIEKISLMMGHSSTHVTERMYGKQTPEQIKSQLFPMPWEDINTSKEGLNDNG